MRPLELNSEWTESVTKQTTMNNEIRSIQMQQNASQKSLHRQAKISILSMKAKGPWNYATFPSAHACSMRDQSTSLVDPFDSGQINLCRFASKIEWWSGVVWNNSYYKYYHSFINHKAGHEFSSLSSSETRITLCCLLLYIDTHSILSYLSPSPPFINPPH